MSPDHSILKSAPKVFAIIAALTGSFVMFGWVIENQSIVQIHEGFAPMQFNTALLFLLSGLALYFLTLNNLKVVKVLGAIVSFISITSALQYALNMNFGIDEVFVTHFLDENTTSPGRMSPNTGICFALLGIQFVLFKGTDYKDWSYSVSKILSAIVLGISSVAFVGYFNGVTTSYGFQQMTHMALHTCICFMLVSLGMLLYLYYRSLVNDIKISVPTLVFILTFSIVIALWQVLVGHERLQLEKRVSFYLTHVESDIGEQFERYAQGLTDVSALLSKNADNNKAVIRTYMSSYSATEGLAVFNDELATTTLYPSNQTVNGVLRASYLKERPYFIKLANDTRVIIDSEESNSSNQVFTMTVVDDEGHAIAQQTINLNRFLNGLIERYRELGLLVGIQSIQNEHLLAGEIGDASENVLQVSRTLNDSGWSIAITTDKQNVTDGNLSNVVIAFGFAFCILVSIISKLLIQSREKALDILEDAKERKEALRKITEVKLINEMAGQVSGLGVWTWDLESDRLTWDDNMYRIYEVEKTAGSGRELYTVWQNMLHPEDKDATEESLKEAMENVKEWSSEFRLVLPNQSVKYVLASGTFLVNDKGEPQKMVGGNFDVTELRKAQERLEKLKDEADKNSLAKSQFLANMSHEIRTPMNGVLGITDLLQQTTLTPLQQEYLELIKNSAGSLLRILNDILDHSKIEAGMLELVEEHFSLDNKVGDILKGFAPTAHQKMVELEYNIETSVPSCIIADEMRVGQIIFNLVGNSIKFTESGEVIVEIKNLKGSEELEIEDPFTLEIIIKDTGIGIPPEKLETIFEPFGQVDNTTTRRFGGTGLGLPIVKQLVSLMGGRLDVHSQLSIGSEFNIQIPVRKGDPSKLSDEDCHSHIINKYDFSGITCLAIDDNAVNRKWLSSMISSWGSQGIIAGSSEQALALYKAHLEKQKTVDVIIVDKDMPGSDGFDFVKQLRDQFNKIPRVIMMLTSKEIGDSLNKMKELDIEHYLLKPVKQSEVFNMLVEVMEIDRPDLQYTTPNELPPPSKLLNVLIAEDNPINSRLVHDILTYRGHHSTLVFNGRQALDEYKSGEYDVILMDVQMPEMDGLEATQLIRKFEQHKDKEAVKIIGLTAHALSGDRQICLDAGMDNYLTKPIDSDKLITVLESYSAPTPQLQSNTDKAETEVNSAENEQNTPDEQRYFKWVDTNSIDRVTGGLTETVIAMTEMMQKILPSEINDVKDLLKSGNSDALAKLIHRMKGMVSNLTGDRLKEDFLELEMYAGKSELDEFEINWQKLERKLQEFLMELKDYETDLK